MTDLIIIGNTVSITETKTPVLEFKIVKTENGFALDYKKVFFGWSSKGEVIRHCMTWSNEFTQDEVLRDAKKSMLKIASELLGEL